MPWLHAGCAWASINSLLPIVHCPCSGQPGWWRCSKNYRKSETLKIQTTSQVESGRNHWIFYINQTSRSRISIHHHRLSNLADILTQSGSLFLSIIRPPCLEVLVLSPTMRTIVLPLFAHRAEGSYLHRMFTLVMLPITVRRKQEEALRMASWILNNSAAGVSSQCPKHSTTRMEL